MSEVYTDHKKLDSLSFPYLCMFSGVPLKYRFYDLKTSTAIQRRGTDQGVATENEFDCI